MKKEFTVGSLFAGVGGICLGFQNAETENAKYRILWANEINKFACETYRTNFKHTLFEGDIIKILHPEKIDQEIEEMRDRIKETEHGEKGQLQKELDSMLDNRNEQFEYYTKMHENILKEPIDILNGGFPCQAFSIAGDQRGFSDERGDLFLNIIDLINQLGEKFYKPRVLFLENVKNLKSHDKGKTYKVIKDKLEKCGYTIFESVLNTMNFSDLTQNRERIYIIGFLNKEDANKFTVFDNLGKFMKHKTHEDREEDVRKVIDYNLTFADGKKYYYTKQKYPRYFLTEEEFKNAQDKENRINLTEQIDEMYQFYQVRRGMYVRKNKSDVCPTLTANMGTGGHNVPLIKVADGIRKLTPAETFRLQGFPVGNGYKLPEMYNGKPYGDAHLYEQAGNAVSVPVITMLATEILKIIE